MAQWPEYAEDRERAAECKCIPEQWQEASAAGNGHERIAVVSKDRLPFFQAGATESYSFAKRSKPICWYFEAPGHRLAVWPSAWPRSSVEEQDVEGQVCQCTLLHFLLCVADHWPGAQAELTWLTAKNFVSTVWKTHSERYLAIHLSFTKLGHIFVIILKCLQKLLLSHGHFLLSHEWSL